MSKENYFLSLYQAILAKNLTKVLEFYSFTDKKIDNYPNEYPSLSYNKIFQNNYPNAFINSILLFDNYKDFLYAMQKGFEPRATKENIEIREANHLALMKHPSLRLGKFFGIEPEFWLNLQMHYDLKQAKKAINRQIAAINTISDDYRANI